MCNGHETTGLRQKWLGIGVILVALLMASAVPGHAWRGGHGFGHGGFRHGGFGHGGFRHGGFWHGGFWHGGFRPSVVFSVGPYWGPYWDPYWVPYGYPSVVVTPPPQVYVQPAPQTPAQPAPTQPPAQSTQPSWYYCDDPQGYYPYVQQCPGGWRPVAPTPPSP